MSGQPIEPMPPGSKWAEEQLKMAPPPIPLTIQPPKGIGSDAVSLPSGHWLTPQKIPLPEGPLWLAFELNQHVVFVFFGFPLRYFGYIWGGGGLAVNTCGERKVVQSFELGRDATQILGRLNQGQPVGFAKGFEYLLSGFCQGVLAP